MKEKGFLSLFLTIVCAIFGIVDASAAVMAASAASVGAAAINADGSARATVGAKAWCNSDILICWVHEVLPEFWQERY